LHAIYVLDNKPEVYGLPVNPQAATANLFGNWLYALTGVGILAFAPFWLIFGDRSRSVAKAPETGVDKDA